MAAADVSGRCLFLVVGLCFGALLTWHSQSPVAEFSSTSHSDVTKQLKRMKLHDHKSVFLLTGAAGFVGFHTATELTRRGHAVIGLDNFDQLKSWTAPGVPNAGERLFASQEFLLMMRPG